MIDEVPVVAGLPLTWVEFSTPVSSSDVADPCRPAFGLWVVANHPPALLDEFAHEQCGEPAEPLPYFSIIWPTAEPLIRRVLAAPSLEGKNVLDLGCGLGPCGFAAVSQRAQVTFLDREPRALAIVAATAQHLGVADTLVDWVLADWREPSPLEMFDLILGSDVLYREIYANEVAAFLSHHLKPTGEAWIADPGRPYLPAFLDAARQQGLQLLSQEMERVEHHDTPMTVLRLARLE